MLLVIFCLIRPISSLFAKADFPDDFSEPAPAAGMAAHIDVRLTVEGRRREKHTHNARVWPLDC